MDTTTRSEGKRRKVRDDGVVRIVPGERFTPYSLARKLGARVVLESSSFVKGRERYSILLVREAFRVSQKGDAITFTSDGKSSRIKSRARDILDVLVYFADQHPALHQDLPFPAGGIGFFSYELARSFDSFRFRRREDPLGMDDAVFLFGHVFIIFDHFTDLLYLIGMNYRERAIDLEEAVAETERRIGDMDFNYLVSQDGGYPASVERADGEREVFLDGVRTVKNEIVKGNLLQGVLSRRIAVRTEIPALEAYRRLRSSNPSPYLFYLDYGGYQLFGSSPEVHVKVKDRRAVIRPLAGTRRRGADTAEDVALERELLADEKERAEHLMLLDLARNDLGRICVPGSVRVEEQMEIERYSHVMHMVSQVSGELAAGRGGADAFRATFPAGTVSGAPKIRAVEVIDALEPVPRRFYAGAVGYMEPDGNLDTCITIRSALKTGGRMILQAGAGIVYDSVPEREYDETGEKMMALARALGVEA